MNTRINTRQQTLQFGAKIPMRDVGGEAESLRAFICGIEQAGFDYLSTEDHVVRASRVDRRQARPDQKPIQEAFLTLAFASAITTRLGLSTGILVLPQRQTALVAKQAAGVDILSNGRLRLGVGLGWNELEYEVLNESFRSRGARLEEQIAVLRRFWTEDSVSFVGAQHRIEEASIDPLPVQRPIPIWIGAQSRPGIARAAHIADGFIPLGTLESGVPAQLQILREEMVRADRDPKSMQIEAWISVRPDRAEDMQEEIAHLQSLGVNYITMLSEDHVFGKADRHLHALASSLAIARGS